MVGGALKDPNTYKFLARSAVGLEGAENAGETIFDAFFPGPKIKPSLYKLRPKPGYKKVRGLVDKYADIVETKPDWPADQFIHKKTSPWFKKELEKQFLKGDPSLSPQKLNDLVEHKLRERALMMAQDIKPDSSSLGNPGAFFPAMGSLTMPPRGRGKLESGHSSVQIRRHELTHFLNWIRAQKRRGGPALNNQYQFLKQYPPSPSYKYSLPFSKRFDGSATAQRALRARLYRYLDELSAATTANKSVSKGLTEWGQSLAYRNPILRNASNPRGYYYHPAHLNKLGLPTEVVGTLLGGLKSVTPRMTSNAPRTALLAEDAAQEMLDGR